MDGEDTLGLGMFNGTYMVGIEFDGGTVRKFDAIAGLGILRRLQPPRLEVALDLADTHAAALEAEGSTVAGCVADGVSLYGELLAVIAQQVEHPRLGIFGGGCHAARAPGQSVVGHRAMIPQSRCQLICIIP